MNIYVLKMIFTMILRENNVFISAIHSLYIEETTDLKSFVAVFHYCLKKWMWKKKWKKDGNPWEAFSKGKRKK